MTHSARFFACFVFIAIALFLAGSAWVPAPHKLQREEGKITRIIPQPNTWHEIEIVTSGGVRISCRTRRGWPLVGPSRCPLEKFERHLGQTVTVMHDGERPFEVAAGRQIVVDYSAHRQAQAIALLLAGLMLSMAFWVWRRR